VDDREKKTLSCSEAARILGLSRNSVYQAIHRGEIPHLRVGDRIIIPENPFYEWFNCRR